MLRGRAASRWLYGEEACERVREDGAQNEPAAVSDLEDLTDLVEGEPGRLCLPDEPDPVNDLRLVVAVAASRAVWLRQESSALVVAVDIPVASATSPLSIRTPSAA